MKKILIFGAGGMIGHKMYRVLKSKGYDVFGTLRRSREEFAAFQLFDSHRIFENVDVLNQDRVIDILNQVQPDVILNCVGITLRKPEIKDETVSLKVNGEFPHFLKQTVENNKKYLIHFSTDCVFSGKDGPYTEESRPSAVDVYGRTKALGEVQGAHTLTLRGSMIGRELTGKTELLEWALSQKNKQLRGYTRAMYSGVTTDVMAELVGNLIEKPVAGLLQVSSKPISKYDLLVLINNEFHLGQDIQREEAYATEKILISDKIKKTMGFHCPDWPEMIKKLTADSFNYDL